jgi:hypothetical protein
VDAGGAQAVGGRDAEAFGLGELREPLDGLGVVVYDQKMGHREGLDLPFGCNSSSTQCAYQHAVKISCSRTPFTVSS